MAGATAQECFEIAKRPFTFDEIEIMPQTVSAFKLNQVGNVWYSEAKITPYFNARAVMERLDEAFGPENWRAEYRDVHLKGGEVGIMCHLTVWTPEGKEVHREDGADLTDIEAFKGGISSALKRAFSALGNRTLYVTDLGWGECEVKTNREGQPEKDSRGTPKFKKWTQQAIQLARNTYERQVKVVSEKTGKLVHQPAGKATEVSHKDNGQPALETKNGTPVHIAVADIFKLDGNARGHYNSIYRDEATSKETFDLITMHGGSVKTLLLQSRVKGHSDWYQFHDFVQEHLNLAGVSN